MITGPFHWRDGWYFSVEPDNSVRIRAEVGGNVEPGTICEAVIPAAEWESILDHIATVRAERCQPDPR